MTAIATSGTHLRHQRSIVRHLLIGSSKDAARAGAGSSKELPDVASVAGAQLATCSSGARRPHPARNLPVCSSTAASRFATPHAIVDYLHALGITDCYASSYLRAVPGSPHGYDVVDPTRLNPDLGTDVDTGRGSMRCARAAWATSWIWCRTTWASPARRTRGGRTCSKTDRARASRASSTSNGVPSRTSWPNKVLIPILGDQYGAVLERQELQVGYRRRRVRGRYGTDDDGCRSRRIPTRPSSA